MDVLRDLARNSLAILLSIIAVFLLLFLIVFIFVQCNQSSELQLQSSTSSTEGPTDEHFFDKFNSFVSKTQWEQCEIKFSNENLLYNMSAPSNLNVCQNASLFVFVPSAPSAFDVRLSIRKTWAENLPSNVVFRFVIGKQKEEGVYTQLLQEFMDFDDLILYDLDDTYRNLLFKVHVAFRWQQVFCQNAKFVLKIDDDTLVDLKRLQYWIEKKLVAVYKKNPAVIFGSLQRGMQPIRKKSSRYYVSRLLHPADVYSPYMSGPSYVLSNEAVAAILNNTHKVNAFPIEDALYTGVMADIAKIHKENGWRHFRTLHSLKDKEMCEGEPQVPMISVINASRDAEKVSNSFKALQTVMCDNNS